MNQNHRFCTLVLGGRRLLWPRPCPLTRRQISACPRKDTLCCSLLGRGKHSLLPAAAAAAKSLQSCLTLCDPIDSSSPGTPVPGILQARVLERVAISFSNAWKWKGKVKSLSCANSSRPHGLHHQAPPSMGFSRQEFWSGVPLPSPVWAEAILSRAWSWSPIARVQKDTARKGSYAQYAAVCLKS